MADWQQDGCRYLPDAVPAAQLLRLQVLFEGETGVGRRLTSEACLLADALPWLLPIASELMANHFEARAVRATLFDKTAGRNWSVPWHQDRTIAVAAYLDTPGFGPWSRKAGVLHVEPPFAILSAMVTLRLHLDDCPSTNAPLVVAAGSHKARVCAETAAEQAELRPNISCTAMAGDVWAYATPILHCSAKATMPTRRRVLQIDFAAVDLPAGLAWAA